MRGREGRQRPDYTEPAIADDPYGELSQEAPGQEADRSCSFLSQRLVEGLCNASYVFVVQKAFCITEHGHHRPSSFLEPPEPVNLVSYLKHKCSALFQDTSVMDDNTSLGIAGEESEEAHNSDLSF